MADSRDWKAGGEDAPADRPALPPHLDPRRPRGGLPPRPPRTSPTRGAHGRPSPQRPPATARRVPGAPPPAAGARRVLPATPPPPRRRAARVMSWIAVVTSVAILAAAGAGWVLMEFYEGKLKTFGDIGIGNRPADLPRDAKNILIVGSDSRGDLKAGEGPQGTGDDFVTGQRADTVILAHLYGDSDQAQLVSFPRDSWVTIPTHVDPETGETVPEDDSKLNRALEKGGPALLIDTIEELTGLHIDHYMQIDFDGFQSIVNKLDGVEVCLPKAAKDKDSGIDLPAGRSVIKGDQALAFVRQRKGLPGGDIDRIKRQQQFIGAIVRKVLSAETLLNPLKLNSVITVGTESLTVDKSLDFDALKDLALRFRNFSAGGVAFTTVPVADSSGFREGQSVVLIDEARAAELFDKIRRDVPPNVPDAPDEGAEPAQPLIVAPESIRVRVFNGTGVTGLGRKASQDLEGVGFAIVGAAADRGSDAAETVVLHGPDKADSARTLAAAIVPRATIRLDTTLERTLEVVVGTDYEATKPVTITGAPQPPPAPSEAPPVVTAAQDPCAA